MEKKTINARALADRYEANCARIGAIADECEKAQRSRSEAEEAEYQKLCRDNQFVQMRMQALHGAPTATESADKVLRDTVFAKKEARIVLSRSIQTTEALADTGIIKVQEQEMLKPLREGLIWDKLGIKVQSGLVGTLRWPKHGKAVASFADEAEELTDSKIDFSKLEAKPERLGVAIPVTKEELSQSEGIVERVIREEMPQAIIDVINAHLFAVDGEGKKVVGPLVKAAEKAITFAGDVPTRKELLKMKTTVAKTGIKLIAPCWVMTEAMKAELEDVKVDAGSGRFLCEDGKIMGYPVFTTEAIGEGYIAFGDWSYQAAGFFGGMDMVVDPYTLARKNATDFVLNAHFATVTLYDEAFAVGKAKA